ncbi:hypothetical protein B0H13DRAFT_1855001 [Mycena leptocephala]|nr:hypothetical protein B0H13DRAFT_1855001 [Mycena leptocephala]
MRAPAVPAHVLPTFHKREMEAASPASASQRDPVISGPTRTAHVSTLAHAPSSTRVVAPSAASPRVVAPATTSSPRAALISPAAQVAGCAAYLRPFSRPAPSLPRPVTPATPSALTDANPVKQRLTVNDLKERPAIQSSVPDGYGKLQHVVQQPSPSPKKTRKEKPTPVEKLRAKARLYVVSRGLNGGRRETVKVGGSVVLSAATGARGGVAAGASVGVAAGARVKAPSMQKALVKIQTCTVNGSYGMRVAELFPSGSEPTVPDSLVYADFNYSSLMVTSHAKRGSTGRFMANNSPPPSHESTSDDGDSGDVDDAATCESANDSEPDDEWEKWKKLPPPMTYDERMEKGAAQRQKAEEKRRIAEMRSAEQRLAGPMENQKGVYL